MTTAMTRIVKTHHDLERAAHDDKIRFARMIRDAASSDDELTVAGIGRELGWTKSATHDYVRRWADRALSTEG